MIPLISCKLLSILIILRTTTAVSGAVATASAAHTTLAMSCLASGFLFLIWKRKAVVVVVDVCLALHHYLPVTVFLFSDPDCATVRLIVCVYLPSCFALVLDLSFGLFFLFFMMCCFLSFVCCYSPFPFCAYCCYCCCC